MRIALPVTEGKLARNFSQCEQFVFVDVDLSRGEVKRFEFIDRPDIPEDLLARWLLGMCVSFVIAHEIGPQARKVFERSRIELICDAPIVEPHQVISRLTSYVCEPGNRAVSDGASLQGRF